MSDKNIEVLQTHLDHWKRLLAEGICEKTEGEESIEAFQAAIEALKESCEAVSREEVLDYIRDNYRRWFINDDTFMQCVNGIKNIVPVTPKQRWIPCSERLPKLEQKVLVHVINVDNVEYDVACLKDTKHAAYDEDYHWEGKFAYGLKSVIEWKLIESEERNEQTGIC